MTHNDGGDGSCGDGVDTSVPVRGGGGGGGVIR